MRRVILFGAITLGACNALTGLSDDYHLTSGGGNPDATPDGTIGGDDGGLDSGPDSPIDTGTDGPFSCANVDAEFCADFEKASTNDDAGGLGGTHVEYNASIVVLDHAGFGGTRGLDISYDKTDTNSANVWASQQMLGLDPDQYSHYELEFDFALPTLSVVYAELGILTFPDNGNEDGLATDNQGGQFIRVSPPAPDGGVANDPLGSWHHAHLVLDKNGAPSTYTRTVTVDGKYVDMSVGVTASSTGYSELRFGTFATTNGVGDKGLMHVTFDNIVARRW